MKIDQATVDKATVIAEAMRQAADKAAKLAHEIMFQSINGEANLENDDRRIGAYLTAAAMLYHNALAHAEEMGPKQAHLSVGMFDTLCAERLAKLRERAKDALSDDDSDG